MKKVLLDTSVITASIFEEHEHFYHAFPWIEAVKTKKIEGYVSTHTLAEIYSNSTSLPYQSVVIPSIARQIIEEEILPSFRPIALSRGDYLKAIKRVADLSFRGGIVCDSLHIQAALKKKLGCLVTFNAKHFNRLVKPNELRIINPADESP